MKLKTKRYSFRTFVSRTTIGRTRQLHNSTTWKREKCTLDSHAMRFFRFSFSFFCVENAFCVRTACSRRSELQAKTKRLFVPRWNCTWTSDGTMEKGTQESHSTSNVIVSIVFVFLVVRRFVLPPHELVLPFDCIDFNLRQCDCWLKKKTKTKTDEPTWISPLSTFCSPFDFSCVRFCLENSVIVSNCRPMTTFSCRSLGQHDTKVKESFLFQFLFFVFSRFGSGHLVSFHRNRIIHSKTVAKSELCEGFLCCRHFKIFSRKIIRNFAKCKTRAQTTTREKQN